SPQHADLAKLYEGAREYLSGVKRLRYLRRWNRINRVIPTSVLAHTYLVAVLSAIVCRLEEQQIQKGQSGVSEFRYRAVIRALFHDLPESLTGDVISPVKDQISRIDSDMWAFVEAFHMEEFTATAPMQVRAEIERLDLLKELNPGEPYSVDSVVKDCDRLALLLECAYEKHSGRLNHEMLDAYEDLQPKLQRSEWESVRDLASSIILQMSGPA
ncbi:MAG: YfbR-like 5'-deoxynucleotidase, partial [Coriobacteriia bacterium]|nr:YfbR-like 5'-deoxynucleotidase [Coriobacteriia bacterium]